MIERSEAVSQTSSPCEAEAFTAEDLSASSAQAGAGHAKSGKPSLGDLSGLSECNERARGKACATRKGAKNAKENFA